MSSGGFGFSFDDDDDDDKRRGDNSSFGSFGFGAGGNPGGLGDILNQFGQMLSGMGSSMNSPEAQGPVNYDLAERIARQALSGRTVAVRSQDRHAVEEAVRLAELWLDGATELPQVGGRVDAWGATDWLTATLPQWKKLVTPVAEAMARAQLESVPDEAKEMLGPMSGMLRQMSGMNVGMQLGHALGDLARQALTGADFGIPTAPARTVALLPAAVSSVAEELGVPSREVFVYVAAREAARQRLFNHVPWLVDRIVSSVAEYADGLVIDTSEIEESLRELNIEPGDPQSIQDALRELQGRDLSPRITSSNRAAALRLETLLALVEGWAEHVAGAALSERLPSTEKLTEAWKRRRATGGSADNAFSKIVGIEFSAPRVSDAAELWRRVDNAVGVERRDQVWDHPDLLPDADDVAKPAEFIDGLLDDGGIADFDPIREIEELERRRGENGGAEGDDEPGERGND